MRTTPSEAAAVTVRRRWSDPLTAHVRVEHLRDVRIQGEAGGVCAPTPRPFLYARVWCDHLRDDGALHACDAASAPHELDLCVLEHDNPPALYAQVRRLLRR